MIKILIFLSMCRFSLANGDVFAQESIFIESVRRVSQPPPQQSSESSPLPPKAYTYWLTLRLPANDLSIHTGQSIEIQRSIDAQIGGQSVPNSLSLPIGKAIVVSVKNQSILAYCAEIYGSEEVKAYFPKHSGPLVGDFATIFRPKIVPRTTILPELHYDFAKLFTDPLSNPTSLEITETGRKSLEEALATYPILKESKILIEAHTDIRNSRIQNRVESLERANLIKAKLVELGLSETQIIAVGVGEEGMDITMFSPASIQKGRKITIKAYEILPPESALASTKTIVGH